LKKGMIMTKLDRTTIGKLPPPDDGKFDVVHWDDDLPGLGLRVLRSGSRSWVVRYRIGRRQRVITLGKMALLSPGQARTRAGEILAKAKLGEDVSTEIRSRKANVGATLEGLIELFISRYVEKNQKPATRTETKRLLRMKWKPLHQLAVNEVTRNLVAEQLAKIEMDASAITRNRARATLSRMFTWAMEEGLAENNPVVGTAKRPETSRDRILTADELKAIWLATSGLGDYNAIVRLLLLTGQRREEVAAIGWSELDFENSLWRIAPERTKNKRPHDVPLSSAALSILEQRPARWPRSDLRRSQGAILGLEQVEEPSRPAQWSCGLEIT
jgi:integrase